MDRTGGGIVREWKSSSFSGWETLLRASCCALLYTSRVKIAGMFQEPILLEEKNARFAY